MGVIGSSGGGSIILGNGNGKGELMSKQIIKSFDSRGLNCGGSSGNNNSQSAHFGS